VSFARYLAAGCLVSVLVHGAGSAFFADGSDEVSVAASKGGAVSVIGSIEDLVAGRPVEAVDVTEPLEALEPVAEPFEAVQVPVQTSEVSPPVAAVPVQPVIQPPAPVPAVTPVPVLSAAEPAETVASSGPVAEGVTSAETVPAQQPREVALPVETAALQPEDEPQPKDEPEPEDRSEQKPDAPASVPGPLANVTHTPAVKPKPPVKRAEAPKPVQPARAKRPAQTGNAEANAQRGGERVTSRSARSNANGRADAKTNDGGTKAASNYKGRVAAKLRRAKRYPRQAERKQLTGVVHVSFTIASSGSVSGIRIRRSSGHAVLDQAAVDMVTRAAPMPKFPREMRQASLTLQVPVRFD